MTSHTEFKITQSKAELSSHSGIALLGDILHTCEFKKEVDKVHLLRRPNPELRHGDVLATMTAMLFIGKPDYDAVRPFHEDVLLRKALGLSRVPSAETLRNRLNLADNRFDDVIRDLSTTIIRRFGKPTPCSGDHVPLDIDVTPFDNSGSHKEGVSRTYHKVDGYAPIFAYLGCEGYLVNCELREGKTHSQHEGDRFLADSIGWARQITDAPFLVRMDSAHDALDNIKVCIKNKVDWIIKRNLRKEDPQAWFATAQEYGLSFQPREGKTVWRGSVFVDREVEGESDNESKPEKLTLRIVFEVIERTSDRHGQLLLFPELEVNTWWASFMCSEDTIIRLYHEHGTSEQFHSELKTDMDLERLPSGKFSTNGLILLLGMFAYNALRLIGQRSLGFPSPLRRVVKRRRIRSVLQDIVYVACRVVSHARQVVLSFGRNNRWYAVWDGLHAAFT